ncbi:MAG: hypothetical protein HQL99_17385, partial [Magnetococcales bacterium]|nr:hypothetical protein [Magnetococcales bacterium]
MNNNKAENNNIREIAQGYLDKDWRVLPIPFMSKSPIESCWQTKTYGVNDFSDTNQNIGVILDKGLVDIDLDSVESNRLADMFLPPTELEFGRASKPRSHRIYR